MLTWYHNISFITENYRQCLFNFEIVYNKKREQYITRKIFIFMKWCNQYFKIYLGCFHNQFIFLPFYYMSAAVDLVLYRIGTQESWLQKLSFCCFFDEKKGPHAVTVLNWIRYQGIKICNLILFKSVIGSDDIKKQPLEVFF